MAVQRPLVLIGGEVRQLPIGDTLPGSGGGAAVIEATVTFSPAQMSKVFTVAAPGAVTTQRVVASVSGNMPAGVSFDELEMDPLTVYGYVSAPDVVTLMINSLGGPVLGSRNINMTIG